MTEGKPTSEGRPMTQGNPTPQGKPTSDKGAGKTRHPARGTRLATVGVGVAMMAGLVGQMEVAGRAAPAAGAVPAPAGPPKSAAFAAIGTAQRGSAVASAKPRPIVLTPHAVVNTVAAPASSGYVASGGSTYVAPAAAAPVASTGGSH
jgi:hypothetical protein